MHLSALALTLVLFAPTLAANAQQAMRVARIGILEPGHPAVQGHLIEAFRLGLRELGYEEGRDVVFESRFAEGKLERLSGLAADLARLQSEDREGARPHDPPIGAGAGE